MSTTNLLMDVQSLAAALSPGLLLIVDCRFSLSDPDLGKHDFLEGHVPGAVYASLDHDLSDLSRHGLGRHPLPDPSAFEQTLSDWGWHPGLRVVAYDAGRRDGRGAAVVDADQRGYHGNGARWWLAGVAGGALADGDRRGAGTHADASCIARRYQPSGGL